MEGYGGPILIDLTYAEALVLHEFLARSWEIKSMDIQDQAEQQVLWTIEAKLAKLLADTFAPDYRQRVEQARAVVRQAAG